MSLFESFQFNRTVQFCLPLIIKIFLFVMIGVAFYFSAPEFDVSEIQKLFSAVVPKSADKTVGRCKSVGAKTDKVHLVYFYV